MPVSPAFSCIWRALSGDSNLQAPGDKKTSEFQRPSLGKEIPAMGIEPILPRKRDFESRASTNSATPAAFLKAGGVFLLETILSSH